MRLSISMLAFALITACYLWPAEEAISGAGLHLVVAWVLLAGLQSAQRWMTKDLRRTRFDLMDLGIVLIAVGHIASTIAVFQVAGDRRAALNLTFEWIGLLAAWRIFRTLFQDRQIATQTIAVLIAICLGLSCYGIWQHHFFYAEQSEWYLALRQELDRALTGTDSGQFRRISEITTQFQERGIPMSGSSRILWENRLLNSSEPFATFSLANTLAGILATGLVLLTGQATSSRGSRHGGFRLTTVFLVLQFCLITYCLILTKSRSAWLGTCVGFCILLVQRANFSAIRHAFRWLVGGSLIAAAVVGIATLAGGIDKEVILESPRSLQFRLQWWTGTSRMLRDLPLTGAGPGNFRQVYLQYKADESSEEIRDPHNFVLDAWSSGGLIGLAGVILIVGCTCRRLTKLTSETQSSDQISIDRTDVRRSGSTMQVAAAGILCGYLFNVLWTWLNGSDEWTQEPIRLLLLGGLPLLILRGESVFHLADFSTFLAASAAMMVNLIAAGGFEIPTVMITLIVCLSGALAGNSCQANSIRKHWDLLTAGICLPAGLALINTGVLPVASSAYHLRAGDSLIAGSRNPARALEQFHQSIQSDPINVTPRQRIAEVLSYRLSEVVALRAAANGPEGTSESDRRLAEDALEACESLISADVRSSFGYQLRAEVRWNVALLNGDDQMHKLAIQDLQTAAAHYPSSVGLWYLLAERLFASGPEYIDAARSAAENVARLDQINHTWSHSDRYLTSEQKNTIERITEK